MMIHGLRQQAVRQRTQKRNALRAHLSERGLTSRLGKSALYASIESVIRPDEDGVIGTGSEIDGLFVSILAREYQTLRNLDQEVEDYDIRIKALVNDSEPMRRVMEDSRIRTDHSEPVLWRLSRIDLTPAPAQHRSRKSDNRFTSKSIWSKHFNNRTSSQRGIQNCRKSSQEDRIFQILIYCNQYPPIPLSTTFTHSSEIGKR